MRIAAVSDIHDNIWKLAGALEALQPADVLICCGDLCSPFIVHQMGRGFARPIHVVFGNNDADLYRITANAAKYPHIRLHGEFFQGEFEGQRVAAVHFDNIARALAPPDVLFFGHNHVYEVRRDGQRVAVNPGALMGAAFGPDGSPRDVPSTFVIYDTAARSVTRYQPNAAGIFEPVQAGEAAG